MWAALFPGQGSQVPGMGKFLANEFAIAKQTFEEASDTLGIKFTDLCFNASEADLALTENTQPCLLLVSIATWRVLHGELGFAPKIAAGHSVGEFAAVVVSEALAFTDAMKAVRRRGEAMQNAVAVGQGGMTAVMGLDPNQVFTLCEWAEKTSGLGPVQPANINAPGQIVISGRKSALDWMAVNFKPETIPGAGRVKFIALKVSAPFHCSMMKPAQDIMERVLGELTFSDAKFPVVQNVSADAVTSGEQLRKNLVAQVSKPVRWIECVNTMAAYGADRAVELGPGRVLNGLLKKIDSPLRQTFNINSVADLKLLETELKGS